MATTTGFSDFASTGAAPGRRPDGLRRAKRHSRNVRLLRLGLPLCCAGMLGVYVISVLSRSGVETGLPALNVGKIVPTDLKMSNPKYSGFGEDGSSYNFTAKTAQQDLTSPNVVTLDAISGVLVQVDKTKTNVTAKNGVFDNKASVLDLSNGINVVSENGMSVSLPTARMQTKEGLLTSADPVVVSFPAGTINAVGLTLRQKVKEVTFNSEVVAHLKPAATDMKPSIGAEPAAKAPAGTAMFGQSKEPLDVTSQRLDVNDLKKTAIFSGNVRAVQGESVMETPEMTVGYQNDAAPGAPAEATSAITGAAGKVKEIIAKGPVVMTRGAADRVTSDSANFDAQNETGVLTGNVVMTSGVDRRAVGDRVDLDQRNQHIVLTGRSVVVTQGKNEMRGQRLTVDQKTARTQLTSPQTGRIAATLVQEPKKPGKAAAPADADATPAADASGAFSMTQFKTDPTAPINLQANQLDVDDHAKTATFTGEVVAAQGDFVMHTPEMVATYTGAAGIADVAAANTGVPKAPAAQINRILAKRDVKVVTKDGRTVDGDWADVDMKANTITVGGDVVLTQGKSVVRGTRLVIDMKTGESKIDTAPAGGNAAQKQDGWQANSNGGDGLIIQGGRPSATFFPQELKDAKKKKP